jgi:ribosomal protein S18 acetylase RimI-like enzyme
MQLRSASAEDSKQIANVWRKAWMWANPKVLTVEELPHWISRAESDFKEPYQIKVAEINGEIVGFMVYSVTPGYLYQLFTSPAVHRLGVGSALLEYADKCMSRPWTLHVALDNSYAREFYERKGLKQGQLSTNPVSGRERIEYFRGEEQ